MQEAGHESHVAGAALSRPLSSLLRYISPAPVAVT